MTDKAEDFPQQQHKFLFKVIALLVIIGILALFPSNYYIISPGMAKSLAPMIEVESKTYPQTGEIMLTAVSMKNASLLEYLYVQIIRPDLVDLQSKDMLPPGMSMQEYFDLMQKVMQESQMKAKAVALQAAGYEAKITGQGAKIRKVLAESNAQGKLQAGDVIVAVDGEPVELLTEVIDKVRDRKIGDKVEVTVARNDQQKTYTIQTKAIKEDTGKPSIGVLITSYQRKYDFPFKIEIDAGKIGGPSAGSMFALEIYNRLTEEDLTKGQKIAGTGTIDLTGQVGEIDGVKQKIVAAQKSGVQVFFVPQDNFAEAKELEEVKVKLVPVAEFQDIINYLDRLE